MDSPDDNLLRVVVSKRGRVRPAEFRLRRGERGLSLFRHVESPGPDAIIEAVRTAGKQGELAVAEIPTLLLRELGLRIVQTPGDTPSKDVNAIHVEARIGFWLRVRLWLRRIEMTAHFNDHVTPRIASAARILD
jgi:hypothetical protein